MTIHFCTPADTPGCIVNSSLSADVLTGVNRTQRLRRAIEVVHASAQLALLKRRRDRDVAVRLDPRCPERVVEMDVREGHRLERIVVRPGCSLGMPATETSAIVTMTSAARSEFIIRLPVPAASWIR